MQYFDGPCHEKRSGLCLELSCSFSGKTDPKLGASCPTPSESIRGLLFGRASRWPQSATLSLPQTSYALLSAVISQT